MNNDLDLSLGDFNTLHGQSENLGNYTFSPNTIIDRYTILSPIAKGGMGEVYCVEEIATKQKFAMKVLLAGLSSNSVVKARFEIEARLMSTLSHEHIVKAHHFGDFHGSSYIIMDLIASEDGAPSSLDELIKKKGQFTEDESKNILKQICDALTYMHSYNNCGIIHRDLKPANILINKTGHIVITDFGLAKINDPQLREDLAELDYSIDSGLSIGDLKTMVTGSDLDHDLTMEGSVLGTYEYMAPEIMNGREATKQSDIYAVGIILYKMLTGTMPRGRFKLPSEFSCSSSWDHLIQQCLEPQMADRPKSIDELHTLYEAKTAELLLTKESVKNPINSKTISHRNRALIAISAIAFIILSLLFSLYKEIPDQTVSTAKQEAYLKNLAAVNAEKKQKEIDRKNALQARMTLEEEKRKALVEAQIKQEQLDQQENQQFLENQSK